MRTWGKAPPWPCILVLLFNSSVVIGCSSPQEPSLCHVALAVPEEEREEEEEDDEDAPRVIRPVRPEEWLQLLVDAGEGREVSQSCTGTPIRPYQPSEQCRQMEEEARRENPDEVEDDTPRAVELTDESVIDRRLNNTRRLVWVVTHRYPNGDGLGPIGLVERRETDEESSIHVVAMGMLRGRTERARLRLLTIRVPLLVVTERLICPEPEEEDEEVDRSLCERTPEVLVAEGVECRDRLRPDSCVLSRELRRDDAVQCTDDEDPRTCWRPRQLLIAEGETCDNPEDIATCRRSSEFMFREGDDYSQVELYHITGRCLGRATMRYSDRESVVLPGGWRRDFSLAATFEFAGARLVIHQQVLAEDVDPRQPEIPPRPYRAAEADMYWFPFQSRFVTPNEPLWQRMLLENASLEVPPEERASR